jgi:hypothetical protein
LSLGDLSQMSNNKLSPADTRVRDAWFEGARHVLNRILADRMDPGTVVGEIEAIWDEAHKRQSQRPRKKFFLDT